MLALLLNVFLTLYFFGFTHNFKEVGIEVKWFITLIPLLSMVGAVSSFLFAKLIARFMLGVTLIKQPSTYLEKWLCISVERQSRQLGIIMPQIGVFYSSGLNAFSVGWGQKHAMFAVSSGLLETLDQDELEAVIGHELAHIENGDMVSLAIARGMIVSLTELPARLFGFVIDALVLRQRSQGGISYTIVYIICMLFFGLLPHFVVMWFSRQREFSADIKSASLNGAEKMILALRRISDDKQHPLYLKQSTALGMTSVVIEGLVNNMGSLKNIFSSHPPLNKRIQVIEKNTL